ncbi:MAG: CAAX prenyl protease-related protein [Phycisphaerales bacterium]|nr:CAAX prenyl protease-related protein [Phycisphaerales bacterium]
MPKINYRQSNAPPRPTGLRAFLDDRPQLPYLIPFMAFVAIMLPANFGNFAGIDWKKLWHTYTPLVYTAKTIVAAVLLYYCWRYYTPIHWGKKGGGWRTLRWGLLAGLIGTPLWILTEYAAQHLGIVKLPDPAEIYNPFNELAGVWGGAAVWTFLFIRIAGPTLVVPIFEELFFRDFLMRALIRGARFQDVPVATFTWFSFLGTAILFGLNHGIPPAGGWPQGILYGLLMGYLLIRTKSLGACIFAHGVTNLTLYLYVIYAHDWQFM